MSYYIDNHVNVEISYINAQFYVSLTGKCVFIALEYCVKVPQKEYVNYLLTKDIDVAFFFLDKSDREFLISGISPKSWTSDLNSNVTIEKAFVTNATANSVAFYAMAFLNNQGYSPSQIKKMRQKFGFENLNEKFFTIEELKTCFASQSAYFLNLYNFMNENDRFEHFAENLLSQELYNSVFKNYKDSENLKRAYNRRVFHTTLECQYMRAAYNEEKFFPNTGVFAEKMERVQPEYYIVDSDWLINLKMRKCKVCEDLNGNNRVSNEELF